VDGSGYAYSVATSIGSLGSDWYGDAPSVMFNLSDDDATKTIVLTALCAGTIGADSISVSDTHDITVNESTYVIEGIIGPTSYYNDLDPGHVGYTDFKYTMTHIGDTTGWRGVRIQQDPGGSNTFTYYSGGNPSGLNLVAGESGVELSPVLECTDDQYYIGSLQQTAYFGTFGPTDRAYANMTATVTVKKNGVELDSNTHSWISDEDTVVTLGFSFSKAVGTVTWTGDW
jgi:hypothetical protein